MAGTLLYNVTKLNKFTSDFSGLSDFASEIIIFVNHGLLCFFIGLFGIVTNFFNVWVFIKQGLNTSINISLFSIAVFDLIKIVTMQSVNLFSNPLVLHMSDSTISLDAFFLVGGWPAACAHRISMYITWYITAERCLCISVPLKVKNWITPQLTVIVLFFIIASNIVTLIPEYLSMYIDWVFVENLNRTVLGLAFNSNRPTMQGLTAMCHLAFLVVGIIFVISLTITLVLLLRQKSNWRNRNTTTNDKQKQFMSARDQKTCKLIILIATILSICYLPMIILNIVTVTVRDFNQDGKYSKLFSTVWSFGHVFGISNSSANFFIYYSMSSNFRQKLRECLSTEKTKCVVT